MTGRYRIDLFLQVVGYLSLLVVGLWAVAWWVAGGAW